MMDLPLIHIFPSGDFGLHTVYVDVECFISAEKSGSNFFPHCAIAQTLNRNSCVRKHSCVFADKVATVKFIRAAFSNW